MRENRIYVAGPMTGYPFYNFPIFDLARDALAALGWDVASPADMDRAEGFDPILRPDSTPLEYESCLARDEAAIRGCFAIVMLPGWQPSRGANREKELALSLGHKVYLCWWEGRRFIIKEEV
jgi:hypothetical protein